VRFGAETSGFFGGVDQIKEKITGLAKPALIQ
jgi:hypothetical protein